jgi:hypothetical protein
MTNKRYHAHARSLIDPRRTLWRFAYSFNNCLDPRLKRHGYPVPEYTATVCGDFAKIG